MATSAGEFVFDSQSIMYSSLMQCRPILGGPIFGAKQPGGIAVVKEQIRDGHIAPM